MVGLVLMLAAYAAPAEAAPLRRPPPLHVAKASVRGLPRNPRPTVVHRPVPADATRQSTRVARTVGLHQVLPVTRQPVSTIEALVPGVSGEALGEPWDVYLDGLRLDPGWREAAAPIPGVAVGRTTVATTALPGPRLP